MVIMTIISIVLVFTIVTFGTRSAEIDNLKIRLEADKFCTITKNSINLAFSNGPGSRTQIDLPEKLFSLDYGMNIYGEDKLVMVSWRNESVTCGILTPNVTNSTHTDFEVVPGKNFVSNGGGVVTVSPV